VETPLQEKISMKSFLNRFSIKRLMPGLVTISLLVLAAVIIPLPLPAEAG